MTTTLLLRWVTCGLLVLALAVAATLPAHERAPTPGEVFREIVLAVVAALVVLHACLGPA